MAAPLLSLRDIHLTFGGTPLLAGAELVVFERERLALVGRNGSGKSTLLKVAAGLIEPDRGERVVQQGIAVRYLPQEPDLAGFATTLAYVAAGFAHDADRHRARTYLGELGLTGEEAPANLSGGELRRAALARALAADPDVLLLDEPTNHLDLPAIEWLETELSGSRAAIVLISHDRRLLERLSRTCVWLDRGRARSYSRGFEEFEAWRDEVLAQEEADRHKLERKIVAETEWQYYGGVTARRRRNEGRKRNLIAMRERLATARRAQGNVRMTLSEGGLSGKLVIEAEGLRKAYGDTVLVDGFSTRILRGDRVGIVGPNGAGKTTLVNLLAGELAPDAGTLRLGANLEMATLDQGRASLSPETTLAEALTGGRRDHVLVGGQSRHVVSYMRDFLFAPEQARTPLRVLSGGERGRLMLARALARPSNLLVLDEPTNDLDLETLDLLQEMLADYAGTVIIVSHDRDFLDRTVTELIVSEGAGRWLEYAGGYSDMLAQRGKGVEKKDRGQTPGLDDAQQAAGPAASGLTPPVRRKLSFKDKHALEALPKRMQELESERAALQSKLADPALFQRDAKAFAATTARLATVDAELKLAEDEWLRLELLREELEGSAGN
jgi:ATP-binding cassette subfamily F protein uup